LKEQPKVKLKLEKNNKKKNQQFKKLVGTKHGRVKINF